MRRIAIALTAVVALTVRIAAHENWCGYDYVVIGPVVDGLIASNLTDLNDRGKIVGVARDPTPLSHQDSSFLLAGARFKEQIVVPGEDVVVANKINNAGVIVGSADLIAFRRAASGQIETLSVPCPSTAGGGARATGVNGHGVVVGLFFSAPNSRCFPTTPSVGFIWDGSNVQLLGQPPFIQPAPNAGWFVPQGINNAGTIVGYANVTPEQTLAISYENGVFTAFELPAEIQFDAHGRRPSLFFDINEHGAIVGQYRASSASQFLDFTVHSFVQEPTGEFVPIDVPLGGCVQDPNSTRPPTCTSTWAYGINDAGDVTGEADVVTVVNGLTQHLRIGFVARPRVCSDPSAPTTLALPSDRRADSSRDPQLRRKLGDGREQDGRSGR